MPIFLFFYFYFYFYTYFDKRIKSLGDEPFAVLLGDSITVSKTPFIKQVMDVYNKYQAQKWHLGGSGQENTKLLKCKREKIDSNILKLNQLIEKPEISKHRQIS